MYVICFLFSFHLIFIHSPPVIGQIFTRISCYQSLSNPQIFLELLNNFPTSPKYLRTKVIFEIDFLNSDEPRSQLHIENHFKRIKETCRSSFVFTTKGKHFNQMNITIGIYNSFKGDDYSSFVYYKILNGFEPGFYEFSDFYTNFGIVAQVLDTGLEYVKMSADKIEDAIAYLKTVSWEDDEICIISLNQDPVVIRPSFMGQKPKGLIINVVAEGFKNDKYQFSSGYDAFWCHSEEKSVINPVIFLKDKSEGIEIRFKALYVKFDESYKHESSEFSLNNINWIDVEDALFFPQNLINIDFSNNPKFTEKYLTDTILVYFVSKKGTVYRYYHIKVVLITPYVNSVQHTWDLPLVASLA